MIGSLSDRSWPVDEDVTQPTRDSLKGHSTFLQPSADLKHRLRLPCRDIHDSQCRSAKARAQQWEAGKKQQCKIFLPQHLDWRLWQHVTVILCWSLICDQDHFEKFFALVGSQCSISCLLIPATVICVLQEGCCTQRGEQNREKRLIFTNLTRSNSGLPQHPSLTTLTRTKWWFKSFESRESSQHGLYKDWRLSR